MMLIKHHVGHGAWHLHEAHDGIEYSGPHITFEVYAKSKDGPRYQLEVADGSDFWSAHLDQIPRHDCEAEVVLLSLHGNPQRTYVRLMSWINGSGERELLVTDAPVFVCNEHGDTVEALR